MKNQRIIFIFLLIVSSNYCISQNYIGNKAVDHFFNRIEGDWKMKDDNVLEKWRIRDDSSFYGEVFNIINSDTLKTEKIDIIYEDEMVFYQVRVFNQNDNIPIRFKLISNSDSLLKFENMQHDFPQIIEYYLINDSILQAHISGIIDKKFDIIEFNYCKVQQLN